MNFQTVLDAALVDYKRRTGISLDNHSLTAQLQRCDSVDAITAVLRDRAQAFSGFHGNERMLQPFKGIVTSLLALNVAFETSINLVRPKALTMFSVSNPYPITKFPPVAAITTGFAVLISVCVFR
jgi:hypothetical protein